MINDVILGLVESFFLSCEHFLVMVEPFICLLRMHRLPGSPGQTVHSVSLTAGQQEFSVGPHICGHCFHHIPFKLDFIFINNNYISPTQIQVLTGIEECLLHCITAHEFFINILYCILFLPWFCHLWVNISCNPIKSWTITQYIYISKIMFYCSPPLLA